MTPPPNDSPLKPPSDWQDLLRIAQGNPILIERVRIPGKEISVEGQFSLPQLAQLSLEDQVFVIAFLRSHGSIKEMEQTFGVSYPTIKARLNRISSQFEFVDTDPSPSRAEVLDRLKSGEIDAALRARCAGADSESGVVHAALAGDAGSRAGAFVFALRRRLRGLPGKRPRARLGDGQLSCAASA
jgi:hypothetical protein